MRTELVFTCELCGSHAYEEEGDRRRCRGDEVLAFGTRPCQFSWHEDDDFMHFERHVVTSFNSKEEFRDANSRAVGC